MENDAKMQQHSDERRDCAVLVKFTARELAAIDAWRANQPAPPARTEVIRKAVEVMIRASPQEYGIVRFRG